jgi:hypothetical protein
MKRLFSQVGAHIAQPMNSAHVCGKGYQEMSLAIEINDAEHDRRAAVVEFSALYSSTLNNKTKCVV